MPLGLANRQAAEFGFVLADLEEVVAAAVGNRKDLVAIGVQCVTGHQGTVQYPGIVAQSLTRHVQLAMRAIALLLRLICDGYRYAGFVIHQREHADEFADHLSVQRQAGRQ